MEVGLKSSGVPRLQLDSSEPSISYVVLTRMSAKFPGSLIWNLSEVLAIPKV